MENAPDISVCIANFNGHDYVGECLDSVFAQKGAFSIEVLMHDDCSTDDSVRMVRNQYPKVEILTSETNVGFCISNNRLVERSRGRFVLLLNNDATLRPGSLSRLLEFAEEGHASDILGMPQFIRGVDYVPMDRGYRTDPFLNPVPVLEPGTHEVAVATGACLWIPRTTWDRIGGFPPWFESVAEDIYLCLAARLIGERVVVLDGPGFDHSVGRNLGGGKVIDGGLRTTTRRRMLSERNKTYAMLCCYPCLALLAIIPMHAVLLFIEAFFLACTGTGLSRVGTIYARIPLSIWRRRQDWIRLRRRLSRQRRRSMSALFSCSTWRPHKLSMLIRHGRPQVD